MSLLVEVETYLDGKDVGASVARSYRNTLTRFVESVGDELEPADVERWARTRSDSSPSYKAYEFRVVVGFVRWFLTRQGRPDWTGELERPERPPRPLGFVPADHPQQFAPIPHHHQDGVGPERVADLRAAHRGGVLGDYCELVLCANLAHYAERREAS